MPSNWTRLSKWKKFPNNGCITKPRRLMGVQTGPVRVSSGAAQGDKVERKWVRVTEWPIKTYYLLVCLYESGWDKMTELKHVLSWWEWENTSFWRWFFKILFLTCFLKNWYREVFSNTILRKNVFKKL